MPYLDDDQNSADESVIAEQLRRRKLYDLGIEPMAETQPPDATTKESLYQPGPAMEAYKTEIGNQPKHEEYHPSKLRTVLSSLAGIGEGIINGPAKGYEASNLVKDAPYRQKLYEYNQNLGPIEQKAKIEAGESASGQKYYTDLAKIRHENAQREAEVARRGAEESRGRLSEYQQTPSYWEQRQKIAQIQHGSDKLEGVIVTDKTGSKHMGRILPSGAFEDAQGHIIADDQIDKVAKVGAPGSAALQLERVMENGKPIWRSREDAIGQEAPGNEGKDSDFERFYTDFKLKNPDATRVEAHAAHVYRPQRVPPMVGVSGGKVTALQVGQTIPSDFEASAVRNSTQIGEHKQAQGLQLGKDALTYGQNYIASGKFTGPGDEALQEKFFELAKPSSGFRMNQQVINQLMNSRSWMESAEGLKYHATTGQWFTPKQRMEIVSTMENLVNSHPGSGNSTATTVQHGVPQPGEMFNGKKVTKVTEIHK